ncbi:amino acid adenylation domain-containing protein [Fulvivirga ulvae]|uniref:non-ribosomal peptide synthetase n=1 Tax=Fulvivirga ulvae TaxID=2904245 RepID=UPI001F242298|nr:non-ribosomal peptide synthetase [Fulvivirga ulvae]UII31960.1 amino acid adenylation domain-containing protein [Fulvivirga ulvae]
MKIDEYITNLRKNHKISLVVEGDELKIQGQKKNLTPAIIAELKERKTEILAFFKSINQKQGFSTIEKAVEKSSYPLSPAQKRLYFLYELDSNSTAYNMPQVVRLEGALDKVRLERAFNQLADRHETLRTTFEVVNKQPFQKIAQHIDLSMEHFKATEEEAKSVISKFIRPFDLSKGPLIRIGLIETAPEEHILMVDIHHIITDGVSQEILLNDFMALYNEEQISELHLQYKDYAEWLLGEEQRVDTANQKDFWLKEFAEETSALDLPYDFSRPKVKSFKGSTVQFELTPEETQKLKAIGDKEGATMFMVILSIFKVFLSKVSNQEDIVIGTPTAGRKHAELRNMIGIFLNTLTLRSFPKGTLAFREFLKEVKEKTLECFENQDYQYEELVDVLKVKRDSGRNPLYDIRFVFQNYEKNEFKIPGLTLKPFELEREVSQFDLTLYVDAGEQVRMSFNYSTDLFKKETVERFANYFHQVVAAIIGNEDIKLKDIDVLSAAEREQILTAFNDTDVEYDRSKTVLDLFDEQVASHPDKVAVAFDGEQLTYKQLDERSNDLASQIGEGQELVALYSDPSLEMIIGIFGILKSGAGFLPLDANQNPNRQSLILKESGCGKLVTREPLESKLDFSGEKVIVDSKADMAGEAAKPAPRKQGLTYVVYTSGSTGKPKGVKISDQNLVNYVTWFKQATQLTANDKSLLTSSYAFDLGYTSTFPALLCGGELHLIPETTYQSPDQLLDYIQSHQITYLKVTPSLFSTFSGVVDNKPGALNSLKHILLGGEAIRTEEVQKVSKAYGQIQFINHYGPTETTIGAVAEKIVNWQEFAGQPVIGRPINNTKLYILDQHGSVLPVGVAGELYIAGDGVSNGYLNAEELTQERFVNSPLTTTTLYRTGDKARWLANGKVQFLGRIDDQVKIRGYRVELGEIEKQLTSHDNISDVVVVARTNNDEKQLVAYYVSAETIDQATLKDRLSAVLPDYMVPVHYVWLSELPLTPNGKLNRKALPDPEVSTGGLVRPENDQQRILVDIWASLLAIEESQIGIDSDFFDLGGNSINAIKLNYIIQQKFAVQLHMRQIFDCPTIEKLSELIEKTQVSQAEDIKRIADQEYYPTSSAQERLYIEHSRDKEDLTYNVANVYRIIGDIDVDKLKSVFQKLTDRHESLRTGFFQTDEGNIVQKINESVAFELIMPDPAKYHSIEEVMDDFVRPFDLSTCPLMRCGLFMHPELGNFLLLDIHHIICDGISKNILMTDFKRLYKGEELSPLKIRYVDYAYWQKHVTNSIVKQKEYWLDKLSEKAPALEMPMLKERDASSGNEATFEEMSLSGDLYAKIKKFTASANTSDFMFMLSVYYLLLSKISGNTDIVIGTDVVGRTHSKLKDIVGTFVNLLPLRVQVDQKLTFSQFLDEVRGCVLEAFDNQDFQYDQMIAALNEKGIQQTNLFDVHFALVNYHDESVTLDELKFEPVEVKWAESSHFEFKIHAIDEKDRFLVHFIYNTEYYDKDTIQLLMKYFNNILQVVLNDTDIMLGDVEMQDALDYA